MPEDSHSDESPSQGGVFGNLPDSRPGTRSPRRGSDKDPTPKREPRTASAKAAKAPASKRAPAPPQAAKPEPEPHPGQPADAPQPPPPGSRAEGVAGIEDLAWAGVAAAAEAATLGVRLASRALDALRGNAERD